MVHGEQKKMRGSGMQGRGVLEKVFVFCTMLAMRFCLFIRHVKQRGARRYVPAVVTALTALFVYLFKLEKCSVAF